jgi:two-component system response regulator HydG
MMKNSRNLLRREMENIMGKGKAISEVIDQICKYAGINKPIFIEGETGTGKELVAKYLCELSPWKKMVTLNCGTLSKELAANELFGSVKGAYTDAQNKQGKVEEAEGGTLFLDELNSLSLDIQVNLLRLIECRTYTKIGDNVERKANIRIIAAGNESFEELVEKGKLRQDLYERFGKIIYVPSLKERIEDIDFFIDRFLAEESKTLDRAVSISDEARKLLVNHEWTGNIRQLKNFVEILVIEVEPDKQSNEYVIKPQLIHSLFNERRQKRSDDIPKSDIPEEEEDDDDYTLQTAHDIATKKAIMRALDKTGGHNGKAIELLGISHGTYYELKKRLEIK